jgi:hypothetical protein
MKRIQKSQLQGGNLPYCKYCGKEMPPKEHAGHARRQTCNDACRQAYCRSRRKRKKFVVESGLIGFETIEQRANLDIKENVENIEGFKVSFGIEAQVEYKGIIYKGLLLPLGVIKK